MTLRKVALLGAIFLGLSGSAQAHGLRAGGALLHATALTQVTAQAAAAPPCPAGVPVQTITVINDANVRPFALALVERAVSDQSMQLRAAWGTPCVEFAAGGWPLTLLIGGADHGMHWAYPTHGAVWTGSGTYQDGWSIDFSHEVMEMLGDPTLTGYEVCDPVEDDAYRASNGVMVSDFVYPSYFQPGAPGPYDQMGTLRAGD